MEQKNANRLFAANPRASSPIYAALINAYLSGVDFVILGDIDIERIDVSYLKILEADEKSRVMRAFDVAEEHQAAEKARQMDEENSRRLDEIIAEMESACFVSDDLPTVNLDNEIENEDPIFIVLSDELDDDSSK